MPSRRSLLATTLGLATLRFASAAAAAGPLSQWQAGVHYRLLEQPQRPSSLGKVEVSEVFWYGCPHCFALEPEIEGWQTRKPEFIDFVRIPVVWGPMHRQHARLFYMLQALRRPELHAQVFKTIHEEGVLLVERDELKARALHFAFLNRHGVSEQQFDAAYDSAAVSNQLQDAERYTSAYAVTSVPSFFVGGKYTTSVDQAGGPAQLFTLLSNLAESEKR